MQEVHTPPSERDEGHDPKTVARANPSARQPNDVPYDAAPPNEPAQGREQDAVPVDGETVIDPPPGTYQSQKQPIQG